MILIISRMVAHMMTALLVVYWLALMLGTHWPNPSLGLPAVSDETLHFAAYAVLSFLLACSTAAYRRPSGRTYLVLASVVLVYGALDELAQIPIPGRHAEFGDWMADAAGAVLGLAVHRVGLAMLEYWGVPHGEHGETSTCQASGIRAK